MVLGIKTSEAKLVISKIESTNGYVKLNMGTMEMINETVTILHLIDLQEIIEAVQQVEQKLKQIPIGIDKTILRELNIFESKVLAIHSNRRKRGVGLAFWDYVRQRSTRNFGT